MVEEMKIVELKDDELEKVSGGTQEDYPSTYDPSTGKGLPVGYFLQSAENGSYFYKITEIDPTENWYHVVTYCRGGTASDGTKVLMLIRYDAIASGRYIPYGYTVPSQYKQV